MSARPIGPVDAGARAHVVVDDLDTLLLHEDDHHHLVRVLRLRAGEPVTATDGRGRWRSCVVPEGWGSGGPLQPVGPVTSAERPSPPVGVAFALTKGDKPELVVQKLTELGVDRIVPFVAERSVVVWDADKAARNVARWRVVAREAVQQSRQAWLPEIEPVAAFAELAGRPGVARADVGGGAPRPVEHRLVLVGPEGGWSAAERAAVPATVGLGRHVLRAETAALAAGVLLTAERDRTATGGTGV